jgi:hypothetical protein
MGTLTGPAYPAKPVEVYEHRWTESSGGATSAVVHRTTVLKRFTWPQDGSRYAGLTYEEHWSWSGPEAGYRHVVTHHSEYPVSETPLRLAKAA